MASAAVRSLPCRRAAIRRLVPLALGIAVLGAAHFAPPAGASPFHRFLESGSLQGFDHACGTALDSHGDVYVASAGESKIRIFDQTHTEVTAVPNLNEPCALAVDTTGNLYVSEQGSGEVVKFDPSGYPPTGSTVYTETTVDASGTARGIAVDPSDNSLYVAEGDRVAIYRADGSLMTGNENQAIEFSATPSGGSYRLSFGGAETGSIPYNAPSSGPGSIEEALEGLPTVGAGNVEVIGNSTRLITFIGALSAKDVDQITVDASALLGGSAAITTRLDGFDGYFGEGDFSNATGVTAFTSLGSDNSHRRRYLSVADAGTGEIQVFVARLENEPGGFLPGTLRPRVLIDGSQTPAGDLGLAPGGAYLGVDPRSGHLFSYDASENAIDEFEATGPYFGRITSPPAPVSLADAAPTAIAVDRSGGVGDGTVYLTSGANGASDVLAFAPVAAPSRPGLTSLSHEFPGACGTVVDSQGNLYVAGESVIRVYGPSGAEITHIDDPDRPCYLAIDSEGNLYAVDSGTAVSGDEKVVVYKPSAYPFTGIPTYAKSGTPIESLNRPTGLAVDPSDDRLFVSHPEAPGMRVYKSAKEGSGLLATGFCGLGGTGGLDVYGATGDVYVANDKEITVCDPTGTEVLTRIDGSGGPDGTFVLGTMNRASVSVDQANGHVVVSDLLDRAFVEEYEASGAFVARYGPFSKTSEGHDVAIDNACALQDPPLSGSACEFFDSSDRNLYVAYDDPANTVDLNAFAPLNYGEPPSVVTGTATAVGSGSATLNGTVNPHAFELSECRFEYVTEAAYQATGFADLSSGGSAGCSPAPAEIGKAAAAVSVQADIAGLVPDGRYRFRLIAANEFGESVGETGVFGPPIVATRTVQPVMYHEATLRAEVDPAGLDTSYRFEYGRSAGEYGQSTPIEILSSSSGPQEIEAFLTGLEEGATYYFRLVVENEVATVVGPAQEFTTQQKQKSSNCANEARRLENGSSHLADCRAYELVTPADTHGATPTAGDVALFNDWLVTPVEPLEGTSLYFTVEATLPGTAGNGTFDAFRSIRTQGGWSHQLISPEYVQVGAHSVATPKGISSDHVYAFFSFEGSATSAGALPHGQYLRTPSGFEPIGKGALGTDLNAIGRYISPGGHHVIFTTETASAYESVQLETNAPASPLGAVYDREANGPTHVVSLLPGNTPPASSATYAGAAPDGSSVVFAVGGALYVRRANTETVKVADAPATFAWISNDGLRVFYTDAPDPEDPGGLHVFDVESETSTEIASNGKFVDVADNGSRVFFVENEELVAWDGTNDQIAELAPTDLFDSGTVHFPETAQLLDQVALDSWTSFCVRLSGGFGRAMCPVRSTPDGRFLVFQSHADLTPPYEGQGHSEVYRYDAQLESLNCVSCDPSGAPATADADLQRFGTFGGISGSQATSLIPNVSDDGAEVFFQTRSALLPEDANSVLDVYEWRAQGRDSCARAKGCLSLVSSGQGDTPSYIYAMTPDARDVFFTTSERLIGTDVAGSRSIYDARLGGGFTQPVEKEPCNGDACQPLLEASPERLGITTGVRNGGNQGPKHRCGKGRRAVRRNGKVHCIKPHRHKRGRHHRRRTAR